MEKASTCLVPGEVGVISGRRSPLQVEGTVKCQMRYLAGGRDKEGCPVLQRAVEEVLTFRTNRP